MGEVYNYYVGVVGCRCHRCGDTFRAQVRKELTVEQLKLLRENYICPMCRRTVTEQDMLELERLGLR